MEIEITFEEKELKAICGNEVIEKYRRAMDRFQTSDNETIAERERKQRRHICEKILKHLKESGLFTDGVVDKFGIDEDCYINPFYDNGVTEYVIFKAVLWN